MADITPPPPAASPSPWLGLPPAVLIGLGVLLLIMVILLGGIIALLVRRDAAAATPAFTATVTAISLPAQVVVIPTTTPAPTRTATPPPSATPLPPSATPTVEVSPTENTSFVTALVGANVRGGPASTFPIVGSLVGGATAPVIGRDASGAWFMITLTGFSASEGWISAQVVELTGDPASLPIVAAPAAPAASATGGAKPNTPVPGSAGGGIVTGSHGLSGKLTLCSAKTTYAVNERVCFVEWIKNNTGGAIHYSIVGVQAANTSGGGSAFQTSWSASASSAGDLWIDPNCQGPTDHCGGQWEDGLRLGSSGSYRLTLQICYSDNNTCLGSGGQWETLSAPITISVN